MMTSRMLGAVAFATFLLAPPAAAQAWPVPAFDAPLVLNDHVDRAMIEVLDFDGDGAKEAVLVNLATSSSSARWDVRIQPLQNPGNSYILAALGSALSPEPKSAVGELFAPDGNDDFVIAFGRNVLAFRHGAPPVSVTAIANVDAVRIGDFDGDGLGDLALLHGQTLEVRRGGVGGTFSAAITATLPVSSGRLLIATEVTGDATVDLVVVGASAQFFTLAGGQLASAGTLPVNVAIPMPVAGDIDGDGDEDIVVFGDSQYVVLRRTGAANFVVEAPVVGGPATHLYDVDGDGDLDGACCGGGGGSYTPFIHSHPTTFRVTLNTNGVFAPAYELPGVGGWHLAGVVDVDLDGHRDLVAGRAVYFARASLAGAPSWPVADVSSPAAVGDLDSDGDPDWLAAPGDLHENSGDGTALLRGITLLLPPPGGLQYASPVIRGDFDGDGDEDLIVEVRRGGVPVGARLLLQRGPAFADGGEPFPGIVTMSPFLGEDPSHCLVADLDGDGDLDLVANSAALPRWSHHWRNDGSGAFAFAGAFGEHAVAVSDFTADGRPDLLVSDSRLRLRRGLAGGFAASEPLTGGGPTPYFETPNSFDSLRDTVACADFDGDGHIDVLAGLRTASNTPLALVRGNGGASPPFLGASIGWPYSVLGTEACRILTGDIDGDGNLDVVISSPSGSRPDSVRVEFGTGDASMFAANRAQTLLVPVRALADVDGDGDLDGLGAAMWRGRFVEGSSAGARQQWGAAGSGAAGIELRLGASAVARTGVGPELRIAGAPGQAWGFLALGWQTQAVPMLGATSWVQPLGSVFFVCNGVSGTAGDGRATITLPPLPAGFVGATIQLQAVVHDPASVGALTLSNALALTIG